MRNLLNGSFIKIGKRASVVAAMALLSATTSVIPAEAAVAGAKCTKQGAKVKIKGDQYVCTQNPTVKKKGRTWVWIGCIEANTLYIDSQKRLESLKAGLVTAKAKVDELVAELPAAETKAKEYDAKIAATQIKLDAAKAAYNENLAKGATYAKATEQWSNAVKSYERAIASFKRAADSLRDKATDVATQQRRLEVQNQTIAASEVEIKSNLQARNQACKPGL